jgi:hypothetical protein
MAESALVRDFAIYLGAVCAYSTGAAALKCGGFGYEVHSFYIQHLQNMRMQLSKTQQIRMCGHAGDAPYVNLSIRGVGCVN